MGFAYIDSLESNFSPWLLNGDRRRRELGRLSMKQIIGTWKGMKILWPWKMSLLMVTLTKTSSWGDRTQLGHHQLTHL